MQNNTPFGVDFYINGRQYHLDPNSHYLAPITDRSFRLGFSNGQVWRDVTLPASNLHCVFNQVAPGIVEANWNP